MIFATVLEHYFLQWRKCAFGSRLLMAVVVVWQFSAALAQNGPAQAPRQPEAESNQPPRIEPVTIEKGEPELTRLLKLRHNAFLEETRAFEKLNREGRVSLNEVLAAQQRLVHAGIEMSRLPAEKVRYYELASESAKSFERIVRVKWESGVEPTQAMHQATAARASAEIRLHRALAVAGQAPPDGDAKLRKLLQERYEAASNELEAIENLYRGGRISQVDVLEAIQRRAAAGVELSPAEKEKHLRDALKSATMIEALVKEKHEQNSEPAYALNEARYQRLTCEIELLRLPQKPEGNAASELRRRCEERLAAATADVADRRALYAGGRIAQHDVSAAIQRQVQAGVELSVSPAEKVKHCEVALAAAKEVEDIVRAKFEQMIEPSQAMQFAIGERLTAEIELVRARQNAAINKPRER